MKRTRRENIRNNTLDKLSNISNSQQDIVPDPRDIIRNNIISNRSNNGNNHNGNNNSNV